MKWRVVYVEDGIRKEKDFKTRKEAISFWRIIRARNLASYYHKLN